MKDGKEGIKVLSSVTVSKLQTAVEAGLLQVQHRTARAGTRVYDLEDNPHWARVRNLRHEALLVAILTVCHNGLIPQTMLQNAPLAFHKTKHFEMQQPANARG